MEWKPLYDKVIVRRDEAEAEYAPGIAVADAHKRDQNVGTVLRVGDGRFVDGVLLPLTLKPGMKVQFSKFAGTPIDEKDPSVIVIREDEVVAYHE